MSRAATPRSGAPARRRSLAADVLASLGLTLLTAFVLLIVIVLRLGEEVHLDRELVRLRLELAQLTDPMLRSRVVPGASIDDWTKLMFGVRDQDGFLLGSSVGETVGRGRPAEGDEWLARAARARDGSSEPEIEVVRSGPFRRPVRVIAAAAVPAGGSRRGLVVTREIEGAIPAGAGKLLVVYVLLFTSVPLAFGYVLLSSSVIRPIRRLVAITEHIRDGDLGARAPERTGAGDEIERLARSFNAMAARVEHDQAVRAQQLAALEALNRELTRAQEERVRGEKLATVGRLSAGVAHEIGNPLGAIQGFVDLLLQANGGGHSPLLNAEESQDLLKRIEREARRIRSIVEGLLRFARTPAHARVPCAPDAVAIETLDLLAGQGHLERVEVRRELHSAGLVCAVDEQALQQALVNLILNAVDAMPDGGRLTVASKSLASSDVAEARPDGWSVVVPPSASDSEGEDRWVCLIVSDSGAGISADRLARVFEPFFTTKEVGKGTGLGLAIVLGSMQNVGGGIRVRSSSEGTDVELMLPPLRRTPWNGELPR